MSGKAYSCPNCEAKFPIRHIFLLSNNSIVECEKCGYTAHPEKMEKWYFILTFFAVAIPGKISLSYYDSIYRASGIGVFFGLMAYGGILVFVYNRIKFH